MRTHMVESGEVTLGRFPYRKRILSGSWDPEARRDKTVTAENVNVLFSDSFSHTDWMFPPSDYKR
jgi:hypothetical protein